MAVNGGNDALTGLFGAYASDDEEMSGSGAEDGVFWTIFSTQGIQAQRREMQTTSW